MEQMNWKKAIPVSLLTQWEINQEMQTWLEEHHKERLQQIIYYNQCQCLKKRELAYLDYRNELDTYLGILLQTTLKYWNQPGNCKCDFIEKLKCNYSTTYSILHQHFPNHTESSIISIMELWDTISTQTCDCSYHDKLPMHGPSKYIKESIPTYEQLQQLHKEQDPTLMKSDFQALYVQAITSWIYARLYQYLTPYTDPTANKQVQGTKPTELEFHHAEREYLDNKLSLMDMDSTYNARVEKLQHLSDLKKANCMCAVHQMNREVNLLYGLKLPNTLKNRTVIKQGLKFMPQGFTTLVSSCQQITGSASVCELIEYEVTPNGDGTFRVEHLAYCEQPHGAIKNTYIDFSGQSFVYVCQDEDEQHTIESLFAQIKRINTDGRLLIRFDGCTHFR